MPLRVGKRSLTLIPVDSDPCSNAPFITDILDTWHKQNSFRNRLPFEISSSYLMRTVRPSDFGSFGFQGFFQRSMSELTTLPFPQIQKILNALILKEMRKIGCY